MNYTEVTFVRHAEAVHMQTPEIVAGWAPYSILTEEGIRQSQHLGESWVAEEYAPDETYVSPILRAINTLQIAQLAGKLPLTMEVEPLVAEQCLGAHEGKPRERVYNEYTQWMIKLQGALYTHQGVNAVDQPGESLLHTSRRMVNFLHKVHRPASEGVRTILAVSHRIAITGLVSYLDLGGLDRPVAPHTLQSRTLNRNLYDIGPCSQTTIIIENDRLSDRPNIQAISIGRPLPATD